MGRLTVTVSRRQAAVYIMQALGEYSARFGPATDYKRDRLQYKSERITGEHLADWKVAKRRGTGDCDDAVVWGLAHCIRKDIPALVLPVKTSAGLHVVLYLPGRQVIWDCSQTLYQNKPGIIKLRPGQAARFEEYLGKLYGKSITTITPGGRPGRGYVDVI